MKKAYSAPDIVFDSFALSTSVAACKFETNQSDGVCGYFFAPETIIFLQGVSGCTTPITDGSGEYNGLCYHNFSPEGMLFGS